MRDTRSLSCIMIVCFAAITLMILMVSDGNEAKAGTNRPPPLPRGPQWIKTITETEEVRLNQAVLLDTVKIWGGDGHLRIDTIQHRNHIYIYFDTSDGNGMTHSPDCPCLKGTE